MQDWAGIPAHAMYSAAIHDKLQPHLPPAGYPEWVLGAHGALPACHSEAWQPPQASEAMELNDGMDIIMLVGNSIDPGFFRQRRILDSSANFKPIVIDAATDLLSEPEAAEGFI